MLTHVDALGDGYGITQFARRWVRADGTLDAAEFKAACGEATGPICRRGYAGNQARPGPPLPHTLEPACAFQSVNGSAPLEACL